MTFRMTIHRGELKRYSVPVRCASHRNICRTEDGRKSIEQKSSYSQPANPRQRSLLLKRWPTNISAIKTSKRIGL